MVSMVADGSRVASSTMIWRLHMSWTPGYREDIKGRREEE
jgi:hypothetical protein